MTLPKEEIICPPNFRVTVTETIVSTYLIRAESAEEAEELYLDGILDPLDEVVVSEEIETELVI